MVVLNSVFFFFLKSFWKGTYLLSKCHEFAQEIVNRVW